MTRLCFEFCPETMGILRNMQSLYGLNDEASVFKKALVLLKTLTELTSHGDLVYKANDKESKVVILPVSKQSMLKVIK